MACGAEERVAQKHSSLVNEIESRARAISPIIAFQFGAMFFGVTASYGLAFWFGTKTYVDGKLGGVATIIIVLLSVMMITTSLEKLGAPLMNVAKGAAAASEFFTMIDAQLPEDGELKEDHVSFQDDIVLKDVTFAYPSRPHVKVLDKLDLNFEAGKTTAIVGPSGSGKSTIVGLIERWYSLKNLDASMVPGGVLDQKLQEPKDEEEPDEIEIELPVLRGGVKVEPRIQLGGEITISGHSLDSINVKWWRSQIGLVQQEPTLFAESVYTNVANGLVGTQWENEPEETKRQMVIEACKEAFADEFIDKLPEAYDTSVGDGGLRLSGGQRQRIAIARAIIRKPKILILDEATSAIDVRGEGIVQAALDRVSHNRTTIVIAHRLSTIRKADRIVVLKGGQAVESGTHDDLLSIENGTYAGLVRSQQLSLGEESHDRILQKERSINEKDKSPPASSHGDSDASQRRRGSLLRAEAGQATTTSQPRSRGLFASFGSLLISSRQNTIILGFVLLFAACAGASSPFRAWIFAQSIGAFKYEDDKPKLKHEANFWSLMWTVLAICVGISYFFCFSLATRMASHVRANYQQEYFESIIHQTAAFFDEDDHSQGTMTSRASDDPKSLEEMMGVNMAMVYIALFGLVGAIAIALSFGWKLALVACLVVLPITTGSSFWRFKYEIQFERMNNEVFAESSKFASEAINSFRMVSSLTLEDSICRRFETLCYRHVTAAYKKARWASIIFSFTESATIACQVLIFYYGGHLLATKEYSSVQFFVCLMAVMVAGESAGQSLSFAPNAAQATAAANRIIQAKQTRLQKSTASSSEKRCIPDTQGGIEIELRNISFRYPTRKEVSVFNNLSLTIEKGKFAALVGASGCGKTSIVSLLERFYDVEKGSIYCNGMDISTLDIHKYREHLSLVAQEASLFQGTIRENLTLGVEVATVTEERLHEVCREALIHDFIISLPSGYNTDIGSRGVALSGGQKQRLAIARALLRNPDVLLLDEATSSLDSNSEKMVQEAFERAGKGRTMVVVAHRLATVQNADVIFVLGPGGVVLEKGNHSELLRKKGVYYEMVSLVIQVGQCLFANPPSVSKPSARRIIRKLKVQHLSVFRYT